MKKANALQKPEEILARWNACKNQLEEDIEVREFQQWIMPLQARSDGFSLTLLAHNSMVGDQANEYIPRIRKFMTAASGISRIQLTVDPALGRSRGPLNTSKMQQSVHETGLLSEYTFDDFIVGPPNDYPYAVARAIADHPGEDAGRRSVLFFGSVGVGKTHLLQAIGNRIVHTRPHKRVFFVNAQEFVNSVVNSIKNNTINQYVQGFHKYNVLLVDDLQFLTARFKCQEEFFHIFNALEKSGTQMVFAADQLPDDIQGMQERLSSRLGSGLLVRLGSPLPETGAAIVKHLAEKQNTIIPNDVALFIAENANKDVRALVTSWKNVFAKSKFSRQPMTIDFVEQVFEESPPRRARKIDIHEIQRCIAKQFGVPEVDIRGKGRKRDIVAARHLAMYIAHKETKLSLVAIAKTFNRTDHTTVKHACEKIEKIIHTDADVKSDYQSVMRMLAK